MQEAVHRVILKKGILIAIEGIDGAGKTTQARLLHQRLLANGYTANSFHEPTESKWGKEIRKLAINGRHTTSPEEEMKLFYQDRLEDVERNIKPALQRKSIVIMDRYYFSNIAYQTVRGLSPDLIEKMNEEVAPKPDVVIILDITPNVALKRIREKRNGKPNHFERIKQLEKIRQIFLDCFGKRDYVRVIDGDDLHSEKKIAEDIWRFVDPLLNDTQRL